jgi:general secretion pathway protein N
MRAGLGIAPMLALAVALDSVPISGMPAADASVAPGAEHARGPAVSAHASALAPSGNPLWGISLSELSATGERPIFSPSRRPPTPAVFAVAAAEPPKPVPPKPEPARPPLVLVGTVVGEFRQIGVFVEETTKEMVRLATGEGHGGWVLRSVDKAGVQFEKGERTATFMLHPPPQNNASGSEAVPVAELIPPVRHRKR